MAKSRYNQNTYGYHSYHSRYSYTPTYTQSRPRYQYITKTTYIPRRGYMTFTGYRPASPVIPYRNPQIVRYQFSRRGPRYTSKINAGRVPQTMKAIRASAYMALDPVGSLSHAIGKAVTPDVLVCARRAVRKAVLIATGHSGNGGNKRPTYDHNSKVKC